MNNSSIKVILQKLVNVGNPVFLVKLLNNTSSFVKEHQNKHPNQDNSEKVYVSIANEIFLLTGKSFIKVDKLPEDCSLVILSKENYDELATFLKISDSKVNLKKLMKSLRKVDNIKRYQEIMRIISSSFSTNMSIPQLTHVVIDLI